MCYCKTCPRHNRRCQASGSRPGYTAILRRSVSADINGRAVFIDRFLRERKIIGRSVVTVRLADHEGDVAISLFEKCAIQVLVQDVRQ
jgi:hypothetical protein